MHYLDLDEVLRLHEWAIAEYGGSPELGDLGRLESALATSKQTMFGEDLYPDLVSKSAILFYLLVKDHPFVDGNKRTGLASLFRFLELNGNTLVATEDELYLFTLEVATSILDKDAVGAWIRTHLKATE